MDDRRFALHVDQYGYADAIDRDGAVVLHLRPGTMVNGKYAPDVVTWLNESERLHREVAALRQEVDALRDQREMVRLECDAVRAARDWLRSELHRKEAALRSVAMSPDLCCTGQHPRPCDCVGDEVRRALAPKERA